MNESLSSPSKSGGASGYLSRQFGVAWQLTEYHLESLKTQECLWRPAACGLHVHRQADGSWRADWPEKETYDLGPSSIGWLTWHLGFWWSMALDHNFGDGRLSRDGIPWPGDAEGVRAWVGGLKAQWEAILSRSSDLELASTAQVRWPFQGRPLGDLFAWANTELTKSAAEIGYARFLYAGTHPQE
jgi:hypothetical protein